MEGLRGDRGEEVLVVERAGLATAEGMLIAQHQGYIVLLRTTMIRNSSYGSGMTILEDY